LLGEAQLAGTPEGALVHRDHLLSVSDNRIEAFAIDDRSAPALASSLVTFEMVRHVAQLDGGVIARVDIAMPDVRHVPLTPPGWVFQIDLHADRALLALASGGVQWVDM
jgi:hypothetical protein